MDAETARRHFAGGVEHFNAERFFESHEEWEVVWLAASEHRDYLQGLIQAAAAWHQWRRGRLRGAQRLFERARTRLSPYAGVRGPLMLHDMLALLEESLELVAGEQIYDAARTPKLQFSAGWSAEFDHQYACFRSQSNA